jgi:hypothetical protein
MVRLASTGIYGALLLPRALAEISCVPITDDAGTTTCAANEMVTGSALLQKKKTTKAVVTVNDTAQDEEEENFLERHNQHLLSMYLLQQHKSMKRTKEACSMYRLTITENYGGNGCHGPNDISCIQFSELNLYHGDEEINYEGASEEQGEGEDSPHRERAPEAFDNNPNSKYLTRRGTNAKVLTITLAEPQEVDA